MTNELKINAEIKAKNVRLINENGEMIGIISLSEALMMARDVDLDLIEISPNVEPPVCKIGNYGKIRYQNQKKFNEAKKKQKIIEVKELKMTPNIGVADYEVKMKQARKFLEQGNKIKFIFKFKGREVVHSNLSDELVNRIIDTLADISKVDQRPKLEEKKLSFLLTSIVKK